MSRHAIAQLVEKRKDICGELAMLQDEIRRCETAIKHIDAAIHLVDPEFELSAVQKKARRRVTYDEVFRPGEAPLLALDVLRENGQPMSSTEIAHAILEKKGCPRLNRQQFETLLRKLNAALNSKFRRGVVRKAGRVQGANRAVIWELLAY